MAATPFKSKMPQGSLSDAYGAPTKQGRSYLQDMEKNVSSLQTDLTDGLATKSNITRTINPQTGTAYTFQLTDAGNIVTFNNSSAQTITVPSDTTADIPVDSQIDWIDLGTGKVTFVEDVGLNTLISFASLKSASGKGAFGSLVKVASNTWALGGSLAS